MPRSDHTEDAAQRMTELRHCLHGALRIEPDLAIRQMALLQALMHEVLGEMGAVPGRLMLLTTTEQLVDYLCRDDLMDAIASQARHERPELTEEKED